MAGAVDAGRAVTGDMLFEAYRPDGELRVWTFVVKDSTIGELRSQVSGRAEIDDIAGWKIDEALTLDFNIVDIPQKFSIATEHYVAANGAYLGDEMSLAINDQEEKLSLKRDGDRLEGFITRGGREIDQGIDLPEGFFAAENYFLDQHELFLAMRDLEVGDRISDSMFVPQILQKVAVEAEVESFVYKQLWRGVFDSVFVINYTRPQQQTFYFSPDKKILKAEIPNQNIKAYLDLVSRTQRGGGTQESKPTFDYSLQIPAYLTYVFMGIVVLTFYIGGGFRRGVTYISLAAGVLVFIVIPFTQLPLQDLLFMKVLIPKVNAGGSAWFWGVFPALAGGIVQEVLKLGVIFLVAMQARVKSGRLVAVGAACGVGFGIIESCYLASLAMTFNLLSWNLLERGFMILFHTGAGALLGHAVAQFQANRRWLVWPVVAVLFNGGLRYLPVFIQQGAIDTGMLYFIMPLIVLAMVVVSIVVLRSRGTEA